MSDRKISTTKESVRLFNNAVLDYFSRVRWTTPLFLFVPVILYLLYVAYSIVGWSVPHILGLFLCGLFTWTPAEYLMHRFVFHYQPPGKWGEKLHFMAHGVHHQYPNDSRRLVLPPVLSIPLSTGFYLFFYALLGEQLTPPFFAGFLVGYLCYDMLHYAVHHASFRGKWFQVLKRHHLMHHFKDPNNGYGVSSKLWDIIFRTTFKWDK